MNDLFIYLIKVNASLVVFYLCYKLFFQRDTFWKVRRWYLMTGILFSFFYPLISLTGWLEKQAPVMNAIAAIQLDEFIVGQSVKPTFFTVENVLWSIFLFVAAAMFVRFLIQLISIIRRRIKGIKMILQNIEIIRLKEEITPFSFFKWIFINPDLHTETEMAEILVHERTHVLQWHSADVIISQLQTLICWINPAAWLMEREVRHNLEFLADNQVIKSGFEPKKYQYHLLQLTYEPADNKLANNFNVLPIKKRIKMMNTKKTKKAGLLKYILIIPVALVMLIASNVQDMMAAAKDIINVAVTEQTSSALLNAAPEYDNQAKTKKQESQKGVVKAVLIDVVEVPAEQQNNKLDEVTVTGYAPKEEQPQDSGKNRKVYEVVETPPVFPGGDEALFKYLQSNIKYPVKAQEKNIQGKVTVGFVIDETGKIIQSKVIRGVDPQLDVEALRVIKSMPNWIPGKQGGKNVKVQYFVPVNFKLSNKKNMSDIENSPEMKIYLHDGKEVTQSEYEKLTKSQENYGTLLKPAEAVKIYGEKGKNGIMIFSNNKVDIDKIYNRSKSSNKNTNQSIASVKRKNEDIFDKVDVPPSFVGGDAAMMEYLSRNIKYPVEAQKKKEQGKVTVSFVVDETGKIIESTVIRGISADLDAEALRVVNNMPAWVPGKQNGENVKVRYYLPINFKLN